MFSFHLEVWYSLQKRSLQNATPVWLRSQKTCMGIGGSIKTLDRCQHIIYPYKTNVPLVLVVSIWLHLHKTSQHKRCWKMGLPYICPYVIPLGLDTLTLTTVFSRLCYSLKIAGKQLRNPKPKLLWELDLNFSPKTCLFICWAPGWSLHLQMLLRPFGRYAGIMKSFRFCKQLLQFPFMGSEDQMLSNPKQTSEPKEDPAIPAYSIFHVACLCVKHCTFWTGGLFPWPLFGFSSSCPAL